MTDALDLYRSLVLIRRFEETILAEYRRGAFSGTTHTYLGQEANAVGVISNLEPDDIVVSNHRCHGHFLAYGGDPRALFGELMGRVSGVCGGRGGSQHLHWRNFYSNGILGSTLPLATGIALAEKMQGRQTITVVFAGDGALGEGSVYEALNFASLWQAPLLIVIENNHIAQTTPTDQAMADSVAGRLAAFGIPVREMDTSDVSEISSAVQPLIASVRQEQRPQALILNTARFGPHSKSDDTRPVELVDELRQTRDPLTLHGRHLKPDLKNEVEAEIGALVQAAFDQALADPPAGGVL
ncbi:MAG TPA: thiamine pyrophosphate-dependent dehydrogenase E1 component subunit alpha [Bellilinea sp.]|nr:thiamine pyrophosphate-dependent dehydrogenase E1 component subunit alpha [Bellilinea sp.]